MIPARIALVTLALLHHALCMYIPEDIEILDGYELEEPAEYYPQDVYFEARSLANIGLTKAIRNKRSPLYRILESPGLRSHFRIEPSQPTTPEADNVPKEDLTPPKSTNSEDSYSAAQQGAAQELDRQKRSEQASMLVESTQASILPTPEKQVMEADFYRKGAWTVQTFNTDYAKHEDDDSVADASNNEGMKGRTPRVNFVTQPKKNGDSGKDRGMLPKIVPSKSRFEKMEAPMPDIYPSRSYDPYLRRYDRYDDQYTRYDPYYTDYYLYRRRYDPYDSYSPRMPSYPEPYYDYPDSRFDVPEPRDYRPMYSNDIYDRPPNEPRNHRVVYYAHLPEIVRPPSPLEGAPYYGPDPYDPGYVGPVSGAYRAETRPSSSREPYGFIKREKKDYRNYQTSSKSAMTPPKQGRDRE